MAAPRVFISSTCYDLGQIRDSLSEFLESYFYEPMLSERGDVFFHPDLHTHESCINEIENCQIFILIIGGRFGGTYKYDQSKSITNAEYEAAKFRKIPVFTFIKKDLFEDHRLFQRNKHKEKLIDQIDFPSVEKQEHAVKIFEFINHVRLSETNNGFHPFEFVKDIKQFLGKQLAGMMYDFLNDRNRDNNQKVVKNTLDNLTLINKKTEEMIEGIVKKLSPTDGKQQIEELDKIISASQFYRHLCNMYPAFQFNNIDRITKIEPKEKKWFEYVSEMPGFKLRKAGKSEREQFTKYKSVMILQNQQHIWTVLTDDDEYPRKVIIAENLYEHVKKLDHIERQKAIKFITTADNTFSIAKESNHEI
ncbi:hypothetical protein WSM22_35700 [Cytophagales bacterium WSM2-2]|nr:hypothetical protein WSM22_35700 [Cytophagales bacterium WSM2-2]